MTSLGKQPRFLLASLLWAATVSTAAGGPIHEAARAGDLRGLHHALLSGEHVDDTDDNGATALFAAAKNGKVRRTGLEWPGFAGYSCVKEPAPAWVA